MIVTKSELVAAFSARVDELTDAFQRVARQQLGLVLTREHAADVALAIATRGSMAFGLYFGSHCPGDGAIADTLRREREDNPRLFEQPSATDFHDALKARHIPNADQIAGRLDDNERRREWLKLPPLRRGHC